MEPRHRRSTVLLKRSKDTKRVLDKTGEKLQKAGDSIDGQGHGTKDGGHGRGTKDGG